MRKYRCFSRCCICLHLPFLAFPFLLVGVSHGCHGAGMPAAVKVNDSDVTRTPCSVRAHNSHSRASPARATCCHPHSRHPMHRAAALALIAPQKPTAPAVAFSTPRPSPQARRRGARAGPARAAGRAGGGTTAVAALVSLRRLKGNRCERVRVRVVKGCLIRMGRWSNFDPVKQETGTVLIDTEK